MGWSEAVITLDGTAMVAELISGGKLKITRAEISENTVDAAALMLQKTLLSPLSVPVAISKKKGIGNRLNISVQIQNTGAVGNHRMRQLGLYAQTETSEEMLFAIMQNPFGDEIPPEAEYPRFLLEFNAAVTVSNADKIGVIVEPASIIVTMDVLNEALAAKADRDEIPTALPANGGNADTVNGHNVNADVPENAEFTDTTYSNMQGATASAAGKSGLVPEPPAGAVNAYLSAIGNWENPFKSINVQTTEADLNTYIIPGIYYFDSAHTPLNCPPVINGWLIVMVHDIYVKHIWLRHGTNNVNDYQIFVRTGNSNSSNWSNWQKLATVPAEVSPLQIVDIVEGAVTGGAAQIVEVPYKTGASIALVEVWQNLASSATNYGSRLIKNISSNMTEVAATKVFNGQSATVYVGVFSNGKIGVATEPKAGATAIYYRVIWLV